MTDYVAETASNSRPPIDSAQAGEVKCLVGELDLARDIGAALAAGDTVELKALPAGHVPIDAQIDTDALDDDGTPTIELDVGRLDADGNGNELMATVTEAQTGGYHEMDQAGAMRQPVMEWDDTPYGITVTTGPATGATTGKLRFHLWVRVADRGL